jgi:hypothetical protein
MPGALFEMTRNTIQVVLRHSQGHVPRWFLMVEALVGRHRAFPLSTRREEKLRAHASAGCFGRERSGRLGELIIRSFFRNVATGL